MSTAPWRDAARGPAERAALLLSEMTLPELVGQLVQTPNVDAERDADALAAGAIGSTVLASGPLAGSERDAGVRRDALVRIRESAAGSRLGIPLLVARDVIHGHRSVHPIPLGVAASFDEALAEELAAQASAEAAADGIDWVFAPMVDVADDPRWGRVAESYGETAALAVRMGAAAVRGFQRSGRIAACAKHFVGYGAVRGGRDYAGVDLGERALRNRHLRPFRAAVEAGCATVMAAFPALDGVPMHAHRRLLRGVLKEEWGFDGVIVADWDGIGELVAHGVAADLRDAARLAIAAGVDVDMVSGAYAAHLVDLVEDGEVDRALVEDAARRVLTLKFRLGLFERGVAPDADLTVGRELASAAARASVVLASWDGAAPIPAAGGVHLTGPLATARAELLGTWTLDGDPADVTTIEAGFRSRLGERLVVDDGRVPDLAVARAREAAVTIAVVGEHPRRSGEDASVSDLGLPPGQEELLVALRRAADRLVVVVVAGRPLALEGMLSLADVLVLTAHPGLDGGALAAVLVDREEPGGRLPSTWPPATGVVPLSTGEPPTGRPREPLARYADRRGAPRLPLGAGRSWTSFEVGEPTGSDAVVPRDGSVEVVVPVRNTGSARGRELVLLELGDPVAEVSRPVAELHDWSWIALDPGESGEVRFEVPATAWSYAGLDGSPRLDDGEVHAIVRGHRLVLRIAPTPRPTPAG